MTRTRIKLGLSGGAATLGAALLVTALSSPATAEPGASAGRVDTATQERMHELMRDGNPGMQRMHELMRDGNPGMQRMHELMRDGATPGR